MLPHALIVTGQKGEDLRAYVKQRIEAKDELLIVEHHFNQSKTSTGIYIDDIRDMQLNVRSSKPGVRTIVLIDDAAKLTVQSQNALLKLLEQPRERLHLVLCTYTPPQLLPTIRSRCQLISMRPAASIDLPADKEARIRFMAGNISSEMNRLASDNHYFEQRSKTFELAKKFISSDAYQRLCIVKQVGDKRENALELIDASLMMYDALMRSRFATKLRNEAETLLAIDEALRLNGNVKLQLMRFVIQ
ncbi:MAG: polymerase III, delta'' subunit protein [Candidatus Saccharibacteria bacterium GW2011_GWC2_48_9]|nr:MAG: polymerase III, delta'' subunit protein [Candidatus Saccharibacteria bacterium GW2011_GWC2_48_9]HCH34724.1 hypothetical protein [Candidatus Saccharibacteria bacterium]